MRCGRLGVQLVVDLPLRLAELPHGLAEPARHLGDLARPEDEQDHNEHDEQLSTAQTKHVVPPPLNRSVAELQMTAIGSDHQ